MAIKEHIVTQAEKRGASLRSQAAAQMEYKHSMGQTMDVSLYSGAPSAAVGKMAKPCMSRK